MIVFIEKNNVLLENNCFSIECPKVDISNYQYVSLQSCYIEFDDSVKRNTLIDIFSLLIDKTVGNPNQLIASDFLEKSTKFFWCNFSSASQQYKIQCHTFEESFIYVRLLSTQENKIRKIRIALKFD